MNGELYFTVTDHLGSLAAVVNTNGDVVQQLSYDAWGRRRNAANYKSYDLGLTPMFDRGFTCHEHLDEFDLINMNGRVYSPKLGRFLSPDPYVQESDNSQNYNRYSYCLNNPLKYTDPSGEFIFSLFLGPVGVVLDAACWGAVINGGLYTISTHIAGKEWNSGQFGKSLAVGAISGAFGAGAGLFMPTIYGTIPGGILQGGIQGISGGIGGGFGNVIMQNDWDAFGDGFVQGFLTGFAFGAITGGIQGYKNAQGVYANEWTGKLYRNEKTYNVPSLKKISIDNNKDAYCTSNAFEYADNGHGNRSRFDFRKATNSVEGIDPSKMAKATGIPINMEGKVTDLSFYNNLGFDLENGKELIGVISNGVTGQGHTVNITKIVTAEKWKVIGGGYKPVLKASSIWDPVKGHVSGPSYFLKIISLY